MKFLLLRHVTAGSMPENEPYQPTYEPSHVIAEIMHHDGRETRTFTSVATMHLFVQLQYTVLLPYVHAYIVHLSKAVS